LNEYNRKNAEIWRYIAHIEAARPDVIAFSVYLGASPLAIAAGPITSAIARCQVTRPLPCPVLSYNHSIAKWLVIQARDRGVLERTHRMPAVETMELEAASAFRVAAFEPGTVRADRARGRAIRRHA
jgi:hypothetical protein